MSGRTLMACAQAALTYSEEDARVIADAAEEITRLRARVEELERADRSPRPPEELRAALFQGQEPLGAEFEAVWDANAAELYKEDKP